MKITIYTTLGDAVVDCDDDSTIEEVIKRIVKLLDYSKNGRYSIHSRILQGDLMLDIHIKQYVQDNPKDLLTFTDFGGAV